MLGMLKNWQGKVEINGVMYDSIADVAIHIDANSPVNIKLYQKTVEKRVAANNAENKVNTVDEHKEIKITVKQYMTKKSEPSFDFMAKWNKDVPMPLRTMTGWVEKETRGMVYMHLHATGQKEINCMRCGRTLTNPVSRHYGIGPECMSKLGIVANIDEVDKIKEQLVNITWEGWVIKSAIVEEEEA